MPLDVPARTHTSKAATHRLLGNHAACRHHSMCTVAATVRWQSTVVALRPVYMLWMAAYACFCTRH